MPSFDSLRDPRRRTAVDVLVPGPAPIPAPEPAPAPDPAPAVTAGPTPPAARVRPASRTPRPAEYADLLHFGLRLASAVGGVPCRLVRWSVTEPARCLRRLAGGIAGVAGGE
jgi:hypothetical protein